MNGWQVGLLTGLPAGGGAGALAFLCVPDDEAALPSAVIAATVVCGGVTLLVARSGEEREPRPLETAVAVFVYLLAMHVPATLVLGDQHLDDQLVAILILAVGAGIFAWLRPRGYEQAGPVRA